MSRFTGFALDGRKADSCKKKSRRSQKWINLGFWETDPKSTSTLTQHLKENVGIGEGRWAVSQKPELIQTYQDSCECSLSLSSRLNSAEIRRVIAVKFRLRERTEISAQAKIRQGIGP